MSKSEDFDIPDYGVRQEDSWILKSPAQRILREGELPPEFSAQLAKLHHSDIERSKDFHSVCARLAFVEQLKYTLRVELAELGPLRYQHENLIIYLTLTCLDIVARENRDFRTFPRWFSDQVDRIPESWQNPLIEGISSIRRVASPKWHDFFPLPNRDTQRLGQKTQLAKEISELINNLYNEDYLDDHGIRRNIHNLITKSLPIWIRKWLAETYFIVRGELVSLALTDRDKIDWPRLPLKEKLKRIADHLYRSRNKFTHSISPLPALERPGMISVPYEGSKYRFEYAYHSDDYDSGVEYSIGIKDGLSQSEIVRLIIVAELRSWVSIEDSKDLIDIFLRRSEYRQKSYIFLNEMRFNKQLVLAWAHSLLVDRQPEYSRIIRHRLSSLHASDFFDLDSIKPAYTGIRFEGSEEYLELISELNNRLVELESEYSRMKKAGFHKSSQMIVSSLNDLQFSNEVKRIVTLIERFFQTLEQTLKVPFY